MPFPWIGAAISAGGSILSSLFGSKDEKTETTVDYRKMAREAERAGFNPLTVLRNGGSAGFTTTVHHPGLSAMAGIGAGFQTFGNALMAFDPRADERAELEQAIMREQLRRIQAGETRQSMWSMDAPSAAGSSTVAAGGRAVGPTPRLTSSAAVLAADGGWLTPPDPSTGKDAIPIWVTGRDRDGKLVYIPNPDGPDAEQLAFAMLSRSFSGGEAYVRTLWQAAAEPGKVVRTQKIEKPTKEEADWWPSFELKWQ